LLLGAVLITALLLLGPDPISLVALVSRLRRYITEAQSGHLTDAATVNAEQMAVALSFAATRTIGSLLGFGLGVTG